MAVRVISPSGDFSGSRDTATIAAAMALMGAGDTLFFSAGAWYIRPTADGYIINVTANNQVFTLAAGASITITGVGAATTVTGVFSIVGFTGITIQGESATVRGVINGGRAYGTGSLSGGGACIAIANQAVWGADNLLVIKNLDLIDGPSSTYLIQSAQGGTITNVRTWGTLAGAGHGNDWDAVAAGKPSKDWTITGCDLDSYGNECTKHENSVNIIYVDCGFRNTVTLQQDNGDPYDQLGPIVFTRPTFYGPVLMAYLKHKQLSGAKPATTLSLSSAAINLTANSITCTAGAATFAAGDVGKYIAQIGTSGALGLFLVQTFTDTTHVTGINLQTWSSTGPHASQAWSLGDVDLTGNGSITFTDPTLIGDAAVIWGIDPVAGNYGTITITNGTAYDDDGVIGGGNFCVLPSGVTPVLSGTQNGWRTNVVHYVRPLKPDKVPAAPQTALTLATSYASSWCAAQYVGSPLAAGLLTNGDEVVVMDGTYYYGTGSNTQTESYSTAAQNNRAIGMAGFVATLRAKHKWLAVLDGSIAPAAATVFGDGTAPAGAVVQGFKVQNFTFAGNNIGFAPTGTSAVTMRDMWFHNISTGNLGPGVRSSSTGAVVGDNILITSCVSTAASGGGGFYSSSVNAQWSRITAIGCSVTSGFGGGIYFDCASAAVNPAVGLVAYNCTAITGGGGIAAKNATIYHASATGNTAAAGADLYITAGTVVLRNSILRTTSSVSVPGGSTLQYSFNNINGAVGGAGVKTDQGSNIDSDPLWWGLIGGNTYNFRLTSTSSPSYRTGTVVWPRLLDMDWIERWAAAPSMGAYEVQPLRTTATTRTAASTRTAAVQKRRQRFYP